MPANDHEFADHCAELLAPLGAVRVKRMFGGHGFYVDELFIAISISNRLYLKTDASSRAAFEAVDGAPFRYEAKGKLVSLSYFSPPDEALDSPALMLPWAHLAMQAALRARAKPAVRRPRQVR